MWGTIVFRLGGTTEVRKRSNKTWLKIDYGQLHIGIKNMWLTRVYLATSKDQAAGYSLPVVETATNPPTTACSMITWR